MADTVAIPVPRDDATRTVPMGREEPLPVRPMPQPINWLHILGPGMVLTALGVGLGETFMWPRLVVVFGPEIRWLFLVGVTIQLFVMLEMARWTLATGESIFFGAARIHRGVMWFFWAAAVFIYIWPGHISLGAQSLSTALWKPSCPCSLACWSSGPRSSPPWSPPRGSCWRRSPGCSTSATGTLR